MTTESVGETVAIIGKIDAPQPRAMRSIMDTLIRSTAPKPPKIIVYGPPGVGKTTFAASAGALLLDCEDGAGAVPGLLRTPYLQSWQEIINWVDGIIRDGVPDDVQSVAVDTIDWLIHRLVDFVTVDLDRKSGASLTNTLGGSHGGFFKGREVAENVLNRVLLPSLGKIADRGYPLIMLAHAENSKLMSPEGIETRVAAPDLPKWALPTFIEWADAVLYAHKDADGNRWLQTEGTYTVLAKNRYSLPAKIPFDWPTLASLMQGKANV